MKIVIAPNALKECLSAPEVASAIAQGILRVAPDAKIVQVPLADGGDGTTKALVAARTGEWVEITAHDPLMRPVQVKYGLIDGGKTAVMEMASISGLWRLKEGERNPMKTTTFGTGEMIRDAMERGVNTIILGIGGSATTDGGIGMAAALGYNLLDAKGDIITPIGEQMISLHKIDKSAVHPRLSQVKIRVASDVNNPLLGPQGAAPVYGPQKGATPEMVRELEKGLSHVAQCWKKDLNIEINDMPGGGAAGGLGAGLVAFCYAEMRSGFQLIADYAQLDEALDQAELVITGEGKIDESTRFGKVPAGVAQRAKRKGIPVVVLAGNLAGDLSALHDEGIVSLFSITPGPIDLQTAMENAKYNLEKTSEQVIRLWRHKN